MKRLNTIFFAGLLCFSLGYIANDIVGEAGVKLAGSARAFPLSPINEPIHPSTRDGSLGQGIVYNVKNAPLCAHARRVAQEVIKVMDYIRDHYDESLWATRELVGHAQNDMLKVGLSDICYRY